MPRSRTITGSICFIVICAPLIIAPFRLTRSLEFVREKENRTPNAFPQIRSTSNLIDAQWWGSVSDAFEDRVPFREEMIRIDHTINPSRGGDRLSRKVERGREDWLFFRASIVSDYGTIEDAINALESMQTFLETHPYSSEFFLVVAPNKVTIYPEMLVPESVPVFEQTTPQRNAIQSWFSHHELPGVIDMWTEFRDEKSSTGELLYEPAGSHFNSSGAMVMARAMINAIDPQLWNDDERVVLWSREENPDIAKVTGDWDLVETHTRIQIQREGIEILELWDDQQRIENPEYLTIQNLSYYGHKRIKNQSQHTDLIEGRSLVLYDSFIGIYLLPTLSQFFADVEFVHVGTIDQDEFIEMLDSYDLVFYQTAERHLVNRALKLFASPAS